MVKFEWLKGRFSSWQPYSIALEVPRLVGLDSIGTISCSACNNILTEYIYSLKHMGSDIGMNNSFDGGLYSFCSNKYIYNDPVSLRNCLIIDEFSNLSYFGSAKGDFGGYDDFEGYNNYLEAISEFNVENLLKLCDDNEKQLGLCNEFLCSSSLFGGCLDCPSRSVFYKDGSVSKVPAACSGRGLCKHLTNKTDSRALKGYCECEEGYYGVACESKAKKISKPKANTNIDDTVFPCSICEFLYSLTNDSFITSSGTDLGEISLYMICAKLGELIGDVKEWNETLFDEYQSYCKELRRADVTQSDIYTYLENHNDDLENHNDDLENHNIDLENHNIDFPISDLCAMQRCNDCPTVNIQFANKWLPLPCSLQGECISIIDKKKRLNEYIYTYRSHCECNEGFNGTACEYKHFN